MKVVAAAVVGDLGSLAVVEVPAPEPKTGQVRVRVHAAALNPADLKILTGHPTARFLHAKSAPLVAGYDFSGVIDAIGAGVKDIAIGDAVFGHLAYGGRTRQGTFSERVTIDVSRVGPKPHEVEHGTAAAAATVGLTSLQALRDRAGLRSGQRALVIGAAGGVGSFAVGIAKQLGAHVTGICSTYAVDHVRALGADVVVDRKKVDPLAHDSPFDIVFDTTGTYGYGACAPILARGGTLVTTLPSLGFVGGMLRTLFSSRHVKIVVVASKRDDLVTLGEMIESGLSVPIAGRFPVRDARAALDALAAGKVLGKIVVDVEDGF